jgi:protein TonB
MSPSIHFPSPFRGRDLPPYGHADWKRLQPALLRRSLAISSLTSLAAGMLLSMALHRAAVPPRPPTVIDNYSDRTIDPPPPIEPQGGDNRPVVAPPPDDGNVVAVDTTTEVIRQEPPVVANPNPIEGDPNAKNTRVVGDPRVAPDPEPRRPGPDEFVVLDELPYPVYQPKPEYPDLARQAGIEGMVVIKVLVDRQGKVIELLHVTSSPIFDEAAERTLRTWRFRPALVGNHPVPAWVAIPVRFVMH